MSRDFSRHLRVGAEIKRLLNELLQFETKDPRLKDVRVSAVELSGDLGVARVFCTVLDPESEAAPIESALDLSAMSAGSLSMIVAGSAEATLSVPSVVSTFRLCRMASAPLISSRT